MEVFEETIEDNKQKANATPQHVMEHAAQVKEVHMYVLMVPYGTLW
jgi:hypothetical protein